MAWWQWLVLVAVMVLSVRPEELNGLRLGIESLSVITLRVAWVSAWLVFIVQFVTVVTRYLNPLFEQDILILLRAQISRNEDSDWASVVAGVPSSRQSR